MAQDLQQNSRANHSRSGSSSSHRIPVPPLIPNSWPASFHSKDHSAEASALAKSTVSSLDRSVSGIEPILPVSESYQRRLETSETISNYSSATAAPSLSNSKAFDILPLEGPDWAISRQNSTGSYSGSNVSASSASSAQGSHQIHRASPIAPPQAYISLSPARRSSSDQGHHYHPHSTIGSRAEEAHVNLHYNRSIPSKPAPVVVRSPSYEASPRFRRATRFVVEQLEEWAVHLYLTFSAVYQAFRTFSMRSRSRQSSRNFSRHPTRKAEDLSASMTANLPKFRAPAASLPMFSVVIPEHRCGELEVTFGLVSTEKGVEVPYQIYRRANLVGDVIAADILYLQDTEFTASSIPPFVEAFIRAGYRLVVPQMNISEGGSYFCMPKRAADIADKTHLVAAVVQHVRAKDKERQALGRSCLSASAHRTFVEPVPIGGEIDSNRRPVFLLGLGHSALVALSYPIENMASFPLPQTTSSRSAFSFPSVSIRAEPSSTLLNKLSNFRSSVQSGLSGLGWWAKDPTGEKKHHPGSQSLSRNSKRSLPAPQVCGVIAIGPNLDPNGVNTTSNIFQKFGLANQKAPVGVGPAAYLPSIKSAIEKLYLDAHKIRIPVLIAHGTKEAYACITGINSLYNSLSSPECTLIFCPTLRHNGDLASDAARNGLANEALLWIGGRINRQARSTSIVQLLGQGQGSKAPNHQNLGSSSKNGEREEEEEISAPIHQIYAHLEASSTSRKSSFDMINTIDHQRTELSEVRSSSSFARDYTACSKTTTEEESLEELREENVMLGSNPPTLPLKSPLPVALQLSPRRSFGSHRSATASLRPGTAQSHCSDSRSPRTSMTRSDRVPLVLILNQSQSCSYSKNQTGSASPASTASTGFSTSGPVTPSTAVFPQANSDVETKNTPNGPQKVYGAPHGCPSLDSLCIDIPGSSLGLNY